MSLENRLPVAQTDATGQTPGDPPKKTNDPSELLTAMRSVRGSTQQSTSPSGVVRIGDINVAAGLQNRAGTLQQQFGLRLTSGFRDQQRNTNANGVPNSYHLSSGPGGALDFVGTEEQMQAAAAWARQNGAKEALVHDAGSGRHLHVAWDPGTEDPTKPPGYKTSDPSELLRVMATTRVGAGNDFASGTEGFDNANYPYLDGVSIFNPFLRDQNARNQPWHHKLGGAVWQTIGEVVGGAIEGVGYLGEVVNGDLVDLLKGHDATLGNFLTEAGEATKDWFREGAPVYTQERTDRGLAGLKIGSNVWEYIFANTPTLGSTLALLVPGQGAGLLAGKVVGGAAKAAGLTARAARLAEYGGAAIGGALASRTVENMMNASQVYDEKLAEYMIEIDLGVRNGTITQEEASRRKKLAREAASEGARTTMVAGYANLMMDIPQFALLLRTPAFGNRAIATRLANLTPEAAENATLRNLISSSRRSGTFSNLDLVKDGITVPELMKTLAFQGVTEGFEEGIQEFYGAEGERAADQAFGREVDERGLFSRVLSTFGDSSTWDSILWGAVGGVLFGAVGEVSGTKLYKNQQDREAAQILALTKRAENVRSALNLGFITSVLGDQVSHNNVQAQSITQMGINALLDGTIEYDKDIYRAVIGMTDEELADSKLDPEAKVRAKEALDALDTIEGIFNRRVNEKWEKHVGEAAPHLVAFMADREYNAQHLDKQIGLLEREKGALESDPATKASSAGAIANLDFKIEQLNKRKEEIIKDLESVSTPDGAKAFINDQRKKFQEALDSVKQQKIEDEALNAAKANNEKAEAKNPNPSPIPGAQATVDDDVDTEIRSSGQSAGDPTDPFADLMDQDEGDLLDPDVAFDGDAGDATPDIDDDDNPALDDEDMDLGDEPDWYKEDEKRNLEEEANTSGNKKSTPTDPTDPIEEADSDDDGEFDFSKPSPGYVDPGGSAGEGGDDASFSGPAGDSGDIDRVATVASNPATGPTGPSKKNTDGVSESETPTTKPSEDISNNSSQKRTDVDIPIPTKPPHTIKFAAFTEKDTTGRAPYSRFVAWASDILRFNPLRLALKNNQIKEGTEVEWALDFSPEAIEAMEKLGFTNEQIEALEEKGSFIIEDRNNKGQYVISRDSKPDVPVDFEILGDIPFRLFFLTNSGKRMAIKGEEVFGLSYGINDTRNLSASDRIRERRNRIDIFNTLRTGDGVRSTVESVGDGVIQRDPNAPTYKTRQKNSVEQLKKQTGNTTARLAISTKEGTIIRGNATGAHLTGIHKAMDVDGNGHAGIPYLIIKRGKKDFPIKLNRETLSEEHANLLYWLVVKALSTKGKGFNFTINIDAKAAEKLGLSGPVKGHIKDLLNLLVYNNKDGAVALYQEKDNPYRRNQAFAIQNGKFLLGGMVYTSEELNSKEVKKAIVDHITKHILFQVDKRGVGGSMGPIMVGNEVTIFGVTYKKTSSYDAFLSDQGAISTDIPLEVHNRKVDSILTQQNVVLSPNFNAVVTEQMQELTADEPAPTPKSKKEEEEASLPQQQEETITISLTDIFEKSEQESISVQTLINSLVDNVTVDEVKPPEDTTIPTQNDQGDDPLDLVSIFRLETEERKTESNIDFEGELTWLQEKLPGTPIQVLEDLIRVAGYGRKAYGAFTKGVIKLSKKAKQGTGFHEAFHAVFNSYMKQRERNTIYREAEQSGVRNHPVYVQSRKDGLSHYLAIEEVLAEDFRLYVISEGKLALPYSPETSNIFSRLWNFIKNLLGMNTRGNIMGLFQRIEKGGFANSRPISIQPDVEVFMRHPAFSSLELVESVKFMTYLSFTISKVNAIDDVSNLGRDLKIESVLADLRERLESAQKLGDLVAAEKIQAEINKIGDHGQSLHHNIKRRLTAFVAKFQQDGNIRVAENFQRILDNLNDFVSEDGTTGALIDYFQVFGIVANEGSLEVSGEAGPEGIQGHTTHPYEFSGRDSASANIKLFLATQPKLRTEYINDSKSGNIRPQSHHYFIDNNTFLNQPTFIDYGVLYSRIEASLINIINTTENGQTKDAFDQMLDTLYHAGQTDPNILYVYNLIDKSGTPETFRTQFFQAFNKADQEFYSDVWNPVVEQSDERATILPYLQFTTIRSESDSAKKRVIKKWSIFFRRGSLFQGNNINKEKLEEDYQLWAGRTNPTSILVIATKARKGSSTDQEITEAITNLTGLLNSYGIGINERAIISYLMHKTSELDPALFDEKSTVVPYHIAFSELVAKLNSYVFGSFSQNRTNNSTVIFRLRDIAKQHGGMINPKELLKEEFISNNAILLDLAEFEALYSDVPNEAMVLGPDNKSYYTKSQYSRLYEMVLDIANPKSDALSKYQETPLFSRSVWVRKWNAEPNERSTFRYVTSLMMQKKGEAGIAPQDNKRPDELVRRLNWILRGVTKFGAIYPTLNMADKSELKGVTGLPADTFFEHSFTFNDKGELKMGENTGVFDQMTEYLLGELDRVSRVHEEIVNGIPTKIDYYHPSSLDAYNAWRAAGSVSEPTASVGNAARLLQFPELEYHVLINSEKYKDLATILYDERGLPKKAFDNEQVYIALRPIMYNILRQRIGDTLADLKKNRLVDVTPKGLVQKTAILDKEVYSYYKNTYGEHNMILAAIADYTVNGIVGNFEQAILFHGDWAMYKTVNDLRKRTPAVNAYGTKLRGDIVRPNFTLTVLQDEEGESEFYKELHTSFVNAFKAQGYSKEEEATTKADKHTVAFKKVNRTDAQGYISPDRYLEIQTGLGRWDETKDAQFKKLLAGEEIAEKDLLFFLQPIKGVFYDLTIIDGKAVPVYIKYSQAVLFPQLVAQSKSLKALYDRMVAEKIDEVVYTSASKVGGREAISYDAFINGEAFTPITLSNNAWRLQVETPHKGAKQMDKGTQQAKNILANVDMEEGSNLYDFNGNPISGKTFLGMIHRAYGALSAHGLNTFIDDFGYKQQESGEITLEKPDILHDMIVSNMRANGAAEAMIDALNYNGQFDIPLSAHLERISIQNRLFSALNKRAVKAGTFGASLIQVSSQGLTKPRKLTEYIKEITDNVESDKNVSTLLEESGVEIVDREALMPPRYVDVDGKLTFIPGGVLLPSYFKGLIPDLHKKTGAEITAYFAEHPELLRLIAFRIPNQAKASIDVVQVAGFLPPAAGDSIVMYDEITAKTGSDFDIDKMYVMLPAFERKKIYKRDENGKLLKDENGNSIVEEIRPVPVKYLNEENSTFKERYKIWLRDRVSRSAAKKFRDTLKEETQEKLDKSWSYFKGRLNQIDTDKPHTDAIALEEDLAAFLRSFRDKPDRVSQIVYERISREFSLLGEAMKTLEGAKDPFVRITEYIYLTRKLLDNARSEEQYGDMWIIPVLEKLDVYLRKGAQNILETREQNEKARADLLARSRELSKKHKEELETKHLELLAEENNLPSIEKFSKLPIEQQNIPSAIGNHIIDLYYNLYKDARTYTESMTSIDNSTSYLKYIVKRIRSIKEKGTVSKAGSFRSLLEFSPYTQLNNKDIFQTGKSMVGMIASHLSDHGPSQYAELFLNDVMLPVTLDGLGFTYNKTENNRVSLSGKLTADGEFITEVISGLLNGSVDVAKDTWIFDLGINLTTGNVALMLIRAGVSPVDVFTFLSQPIMQEYVDLVNAYGAETIPEVYITNKDGSRFLAQPKHILFEQYERKILDASDELYDGQTLEDSLVVMNSKEYYEKQMSMLTAYLELEAPAKQVRDNNAASKADTDATSYDIAQVLVYTEMQRWMETDGYIGNFTNKFRGTMHEEYLKAALAAVGDWRNGKEGIFGSLFLEAKPNYMAYIIEMMKFLGFSHLRDTQTELVRELMFNTTIALLSGHPIFPKGNKIIEFLNEGFAAKRGTHTMARRLLDFQKDDRVGNNILIKFLQAELATTDKGIEAMDFIKGKLGRSNQYDQDTYIQAWEELLNHSDADVKAFAEDLVSYALMITGMKKQMYGFHDYIPPSYMEKVGFNEYTKDLMESLSYSGETLDGIRDRVFRSMYEDTRVIKAVSQKKIDAMVDKKYRDAKGNLVALTLDSEKALKNAFIIGFTLHENPVYPAYFKSKATNQLYKWVGNNDQNEGIYVATQQLGFKTGKGVNVFELGTDTHFVSSNHINATEFNFKGGEELRNSISISPEPVFTDRFGKMPPPDNIVRWSDDANERKDFCE